MRTLYYNGNVRTLDLGNPSVTTFATNAGHFESVGGTEPHPSHFDNAVDLEGKTVVPGFNDNHIHALSFGEYASRPDLAGLAATDIVDLLKNHYRDAEPGTLLTGHRWDYPACPEPTRHILDSAFPDNPVVLFQYGGHAGWANSLALTHMGVSSKGADPEGTTVMRDKNGEPTGIVDEVIHTSYVMRDYRRKFVDRHLNERYLRFALKELGRHGVTSVQDNTWSFVTIGNLKKLENLGDLTARFSCWTYGDNWLYRALMVLSPRDGLRYRRGPYKHFLDGMFSAQTAWLSEPYLTALNGNGHGKSAQQILGILKTLHKKRRQAAFHAIGDRAVTEFLNAIEQLYHQHPDARSLRFRIEHAQLISPTDFQRLKDLEIIISAQPSALISPDKDIKLLGSERALRAYPYKSLLNHGIPLSFGSDYPGESTFPPLKNIHLAATRSGPERISAEQALRAYTEGSSYAEFQESEKGAIKQGMVADFTILSADILTIPPELIESVEVIATYVGGENVYQDT